MVMNQTIPQTAGPQGMGGAPSPGGDEDTMVTNQLINIVASLPLPIKKEMLSALSQAQAGAGPQEGGIPSSAPPTGGGPPVSGGPMI